MEWLAKQTSYFCLSELSGFTAYITEQQIGTQATAEALVYLR